MSKIALITGITGQDGAYLAEFLLQKGYRVHGLRQPLAVPDTATLETVLGLNSPQVKLHYADVTDGGSVISLISKICPDEIYNLAAQSHVHTSFAVPDMTLQVNAGGPLRMLEAIRMMGLAEKVKFFQASTSELFGDAPPAQNEQTLMNPRSPYAAAKLYAYHMVKIYREAYGIYACNGIMFNHESPVRGENFVTRKIAAAVAAITYGQQDVLRLGNLDAVRDWSHAADMMMGAWLSLQQEEADDYVFSSGEAKSVRDFVTEAFKVAGIDLSWQGQGLQEIAREKRSGRTLVAVDPALFRPLEVDNLLGNSVKARNKLGWRSMVDFRSLVREMVDAELTLKHESISSASKHSSYG